LETEAQQRRGLHIEFRTLRAETELVPALRRITQECRARSLKPVIHLETHGSPAGLGLDTASIVPWAELVGPLRDLNRTTSFNLLITLAVCHGAHLVSVLDANEASPLLALIGPDEIIFESAVHAGYATFYRTLCRTLDLEAAFDDLRSADPTLPEAWQLYDAKWYFSVVYGYYMEKHLGPGGLRELERAIVSKARRKSAPETQVNLRPSVRHALRQDKSAYFDVLRRHFFMLEEFPDIEGRFAVTEAECQEVFEHWKSSTGRGVA